MIRIDALVDRVKEHGQTACAITDHGTLAGVVKFTDSCLKRGIKPIIGMEAYIAPDSRFRKHYPKDPETKKPTHSASHIILIAKTAKGWDNLRILSTKGFTEGFYKKPRIDHELLERHSEGLIVSTACIGGDISAHLQAGLTIEGEGKVPFDPGLAAMKIAWYVSVFGENFYIELQEHFSEAQTAINNWYRERYPAEMTYASADCHYINEEDEDTHDTLIAAASASGKTDPKRWAFPTDQCWLKSTQEMEPYFSESELTNTRRIADSIEFELPLRKQWFMPELPADIIEKSTPKEVFRANCVLGLLERLDWPTIEEAPDYKKRLDYEMDVFVKGGFVEYALILWDLMRWCKQNGILTGDGRGSGAGSLVLFALGITNVDPVLRDCPFERFINPGRIANFAPPDVDLDFPQTRRQDVLAYLRERYGEKNVCQIGTYATLGAPALIRKLAPVLGLPFGITAQLTATIPGGDSFQGKGPAGEIKGLTLEDIYRQSDRFRQLIDGLKDQGSALLHYGKGLQELGDHASTHASGVIIANRPVEDLIPLMTAKSGTKEELTLAQFDMFDVEAVGLLKFDILGLKTLDVLDYVKKMILAHDDPNFDWEKIDLEDPAAMALLTSGHTIGIFQAEGEGFGRLLPQTKPKTIADLAILTSLCRPGPSLAGATASYVRRRQGIEAITYDIPALRPILEGSLGVLAFQEQIMEIAHKLAGFTLSEADELRKVMGKKIRDKMPLYQRKFVDGLESHSNISPHQGQKLWETIVPMAEYVFNKSHAVAYSYTTAKCAYAKAHYPAYFLAAAMTSEITGAGAGLQLPTLIRDALRTNCLVLPPNINQSSVGYAALDPQTILLGLKAVRGIGDASAEAIVAARERGGPFTSRQDFRSRLSPTEANKGHLEALIAAGAFDEMEDTNRLIDVAQLQSEFHLFGFYLSGHPCEIYRQTWLDKFPDIKTLDEILTDWRKETAFVHGKYGRKQVNRFKESHVRCIVTKIEKKKSKRTQKFNQFFDIEDETGSMKIMLRQERYAQFGSPEIKKGSMLDLVGRKEESDFGGGYFGPSALLLL